MALPRTNAPTDGADTVSSSTDIASGELVASTHKSSRKRSQLQEETVSSSTDIASGALGASTHKSSRKRRQLQEETVSSSTDKQPKVGPDHQAKIPELLTEEQRKTYITSRQELADIQWRPTSILDHKTINKFIQKYEEKYGSGRPNHKLAKKLVCRDNQTALKRLFDNGLDVESTLGPPIPNRLFKCPQCKKYFIGKDNIENHLHTQH